MSLSIGKGRVEALLSRNGIGKTTLLNSVVGLAPLWSGAVRVDGVDVSCEPAYRRAANGIALC